MQREDDQGNDELAPEGDDGEAGDASPGLGGTEALARSLSRYAANANAIDRTIGPILASQRRTIQMVQPILERAMRTAESVAPIVEAGLRAQRDIRPILDSVRLSAEYLQGLERVQRTIREGVAGYATYAEVFQESLEKSVLPLAEFVASAYQRQLELLSARERRMREALVEMGWWFPPSASRAALHRVGELALDGDKRAVRREMLKLARGREMSQMIARWLEVPVFRDRERFIRDGLRDHRDGRYRVSVPTLLPLLEGIAIAEFDPGSRESGPRTAVMGAAASYRQSLEGAIVDTVSFLWSRMEFAEEKPSSRRLNRHFILHGRSTGYGTEENSARVLFALDQLYSLVAARRESDAEIGASGAA
jgi:hypothetical protein